MEQTTTWLCPICEKVLDPEQLIALRKFKSSLGEAGVLYKSFGDTESLNALLSTDLAKSIQMLLENRAMAIVEKPAEYSAAKTREEPHEDEDYGLLDYLDDFSSSNASSNELIEQLSAAMARMTELTETRTRELTELQALGAVPGADIRRLLRRTAEDWIEFSGRAERIGGELRTSRERVTRAIAGAIPILIQDGTDSNETARDLVDKLRSLATTCHEAADITVQYKDTVAKFPRMTAEVNRAKRQLVSVLDSISTIHADHATVLEEIVGSFNFPRSP